VDGCYHEVRDRDLRVCDERKDGDGRFGGAGVVVRLMIDDESRESLSGRGAG
jgi:hypothetical protein